MSSRPATDTLTTTAREVDDGSSTACTARSRPWQSTTCPATRARRLYWSAMVTDEIHFAHTLALRNGLPNAQLAIVPGARHGVLGEKPDLCNR